MDALPASMTATCAAAPATLAACKALWPVSAAALAVESSVGGEVRFPVTVARPLMTEMVTSSPAFAETTALAHGVSESAPTKRAHTVPLLSTLVTVPRVALFLRLEGDSASTADANAFPSVCPIMRASPTSRIPSARLRSLSTAT